jgi:hypothetical protein
MVIAANPYRSHSLHSFISPCVVLRCDAVNRCSFHPSSARSVLRSHSESLPFTGGFLRSDSLHLLLPNSPLSDSPAARSAVLLRDVLHHNSRTDADKATHADITTCTSAPPIASSRPAAIILHSRQVVFVVSSSCSCWKIHSRPQVGSRDVREGEAGCQQ